MRIVLAMAAVAVGRKFQVHRVLVGVTGLANDFLVSARQWIFCLGRMVVTPARPAVRIVAIPTLGSETSLMFILVAFFAGYGLVLVSRRPMTFFAGDRSVQPDQRKAGDVMVECSVLPPIDLVVAPFASRTEFVLVRILFLVARDASRR